MNDYFNMFSLRCDAYSLFFMVIPLNLIAQPFDYLDLAIEDIDIENRARSVGLSYAAPNGVAGDEAIAFRVETSANLNDWEWSKTIVAHAEAPEESEGLIFFSDPLAGRSPNLLYSSIRPTRWRIALILVHAP